jgi:hypothetical protein
MTYLCFYTSNIFQSTKNTFTETRMQEFSDLLPIFLPVTTPHKVIILVLRVGSAAITSQGTGTQELVS